jgi:hypothetical protein
VNSYLELGSQAFRLLRFRQDQISQSEGVSLDMSFLKSKGRKKRTATESSSASKAKGSSTKRKRKSNPRSPTLEQAQEAFYSDEGDPDGADRSMEDEEEALLQAAVIAGSDDWDLVVSGEQSEVPRQKRKSRGVIVDSD